MKKYYAITFNLDVVPLGEHEDFTSANMAGDTLDDGDPAMRVTDREGLLHLMEEIDTVTS